MNKDQYVAIRKRFFPDDPAAFLMELGYGGNRSTLKTRARRFENGDLPIPNNVARFVWLLNEWCLQANRLDSTPESLDALPEWPKDTGESC